MQWTAVRTSSVSVIFMTVVIYLTGTVCDFRLSYGRVLSRRSKIIAVNREKSQLLKNSDMFWMPTVAIQGITLTEKPSLGKWSSLIFMPDCSSVCPSLCQFHVFTCINPTLLCLLAGDAGSFLMGLSKGLMGHKCPQSWPQSLKDADRAKEKANRYICQHSLEWTLPLLWI